jgi:acetyl-CoA carboxylase biotin carboxyl carrier protein
MANRIEVLSDVAGKVWKIEAKIGDTLGVEDTVMILESMKMEIPVETEKAGKLMQLLVSEGDPVDEGQAVAVLEV